MKPDLKEFSNTCPGVDERFVREHFSRLDEPYFRSFQKSDIRQHVTKLYGLSPEHPVEFLVKERRDRSIDCTVLAFDYPHEFSIITGILAGLGYSVSSGDVFTYSRDMERSRESGSQKTASGGLTLPDIMQRGRIIDHFTGTLDTPLALHAWIDEARKNMERIIGLLERGDGPSVREAKQKVNDMVVSRLARLQPGSRESLMPIQMDVDNQAGPHTRIRVVSADTPAFLYALSNALSLHDIRIEHVRIRTIRGHVEDRIDLADRNGMRIEDPERLDRIRFSVLLTKHFSYFLGNAPDPYAAISRFEYLVEDIFQQSKTGQWSRLLTDPLALQDLAKLLGASDFLWEDFIRQQYETLLPILQKRIKGRHFPEPMETTSERLREILRNAPSSDERMERVNAFKDREIFHIDLGHILDPSSTFQDLSRRLTHLAETIVNAAVECIYDELAERFGRPKTSAGLDTAFSVLGLGKLGGAALGYASDIELLFVYRDHGRTDGKKSIENAEFFERLVQGIIRFIKAKREGIFHLDLRLRPYGNAGPLACSLESYCRYYGIGGPAHAYERLALVRMRAIGGDMALGSRLERLRDDMVYFSDHIDMEEFRHLRERQLQEKTTPGQLNAKFSVGGLVDLEYGVQILQVVHGKGEPRLITPRIHDALNALSETDILSADEKGRLVEAYDFLRRLINGMRMLRGSARDLFLPPAGSEEFGHLARRMGYQRGGPLEPAERLRLDFETHTAFVRLFNERHFGRASLAGPGGRTVVDMIYSEGLPTGLRNEILTKAGFKDPARAYINLTGLAGRGHRRDTFARLALLACDILARKPDPDMALNNWERFVHSFASPEFHYNLLLSQPMRLEILLSIFSGSQFLADTLVRNPGFLDWIMMPENLNNMRRTGDIADELKAAMRGCSTEEEWLNKVRRLKRREMLRIGTRDMCLGIPVRDMTLELSMLAEAIVQAVLEGVWTKAIGAEGIAAAGGDPRDRLCILALGKLGGNELNYSSDIDLLGFWDDRSVRPSPEDPCRNKALFSEVMEKTGCHLSGHTEEGYAYRVDLRLRPFGRAGELVPSFNGLLNYYRDHAALWEIQAALKMRPIAGNMRLGYEFLEHIRPVIAAPRDPGRVVGDIRKMRCHDLKASSERPGIDVKNGAGGLRDVEFLVQGLQLLHAPKKRHLIEGNTLAGLDLLGEAHILPAHAVAQLKEDYCFLRQVEHCLQIMEDRQIHAIPDDRNALQPLARRILGIDSNAAQFLDHLKEGQDRIRKAFRTYLTNGGAYMPEEGLK